MKQAHSCYHLTEDRQGHRLTDVLEVHFLELPKLFEKEIPIEEKEVEQIQKGILSSLADTR